MIKAQQIEFGFHHGIAKRIPVQQILVETLCELGRYLEWKLAPNTVNQRLAALRFFYIQTLKRAWSVAETPYPKKVLKLPIILSQEEVARPAS